MQFLELAYLKKNVIKTDDNAIYLYNSINDDSVTKKFNSKIFEQENKIFKKSITNKFNLIKDWNLKKITFVTIHIDPYFKFEHKYKFVTKLLENLKNDNYIEENINDYKKIVDCIQHLKLENEYKFLIDYFNNSTKSIDCSKVYSTESTFSNKTVIYSCVFFNEMYLNLINLLLTSYKLFGNFSEDIDYLIICNPNFQTKIQAIFDNLNINGKIWCLDLNTKFEACYSRLKIFDYPNINLYNKILYLDCDILVTNSINNILDFQLENKLYALKEGNTNHPYWPMPAHGGLCTADSSGLTTPVTPS